MRMVEKEGRTKDEAIKMALQELNAKEEDVRIETLEEGKKSFLGLLGDSKPARVRVYLVKSGGDNVVGLVQEICDKMGLKVTVSITSEEDEKTELKIDSPDSGILIGRRGKTLEALQYIVNVIINSGGDKGRKIILDIEGYREKRKESLTKLALNIAQKVRRTGRPHLLEEMNPYERRIIHMALENEGDIETTSIGNNQNAKRVKIFQKRGERPAR
jgi:spoIIIJ-associated protein